MIAPGKNEMNVGKDTVSEVLKRYRAQVNPDLLFVAIDLFGSGKSIVDINTDNPKEILITGFSDNILRFIAEKGNQKQLDYVRSIDEIKKLGQPKQPRGKGKGKANQSKDKDAKKPSDENANKMEL